MGIQVDWYEHDSLQPVIYWAFDPDWDWNDFASADRKAYEMAGEVERTVHSIVDVRESKRLPRSGAINYFSKSVQNAPPNRGKVVLVGLSPLLAALEPIIRRLYPEATTNYITVKTSDEAFALLIEQDSVEE